MQRVRSLFGRLVNDDDLRHWYIHADRIVIHPNYTDASKVHRHISRRNLDVTYIIMQAKLSQLGKDDIAWAHVPTIFHKPKTIKFSCLTLVLRFYFYAHVLRLEEKKPPRV